MSNVGGGQVRYGADGVVFLSQKDGTWIGRVNEATGEQVIARKIQGRRWRAWRQVSRDFYGLLKGEAQEFKSLTVLLQSWQRLAPPK